MRRVEDGASAAETADAIVSIWQQIDAALSPVLGQRGVGSLYQRSLHLTAATHSWLAEGQDESRPAFDLAALKRVLAGQDGGTAAAAGGDLLQTFHELLASLIGPALTEQLLHSLWADAANGPTAQEGSR